MEGRNDGMLILRPLCGAQRGPLANWKFCFIRQFRSDCHVTDSLQGYHVVAFQDLIQSGVRKTQSQTSCASIGQIE